MYQDSVIDLWERIRDLLRKLRGEGLWRGAETHLLPKLQIWLEAERRGAGVTPATVVIHLSDSEVEVWAEHLPGKQRYHLKDFAHDLESFVRHLVALCKGGQYLRTRSDTAEYRQHKEGQ